MKTTVKNVEKNILVLRLERTQKDVGQLRSKLNSYVCEPKTYSLFEQIEFLRGSLDRMSANNREIIQAIRDRKKSMGDYMEKAKEQILEFHELQRGVEEYVSVVRS